MAIYDENDVLVGSYSVRIPISARTVIQNQESSDIYVATVEAGAAAPTQGGTVLEINESLTIEAGMDVFLRASSSRSVRVDFTQIEPAA